MTSATQTMPMTATVGRALHQQGVGGRSKALRNRMIRRVVALCALALVLSMAQVWSRVQGLQLRYDMTGLQKRAADLQQQLNRLQMTVAALKAPDRLERVAKETLGLQLPAPGQIVFVREHDDGKQGIDAGADGVRSAAPASD